jgi:hypothetical protein
LNYRRKKFNTELTENTEFAEKNGQTAEQETGVQKNGGL